MIHLRIHLKIVTDDLLSLDRDILIKLTQSTEAIHFGEYQYSTDIEEFLEIIFIENECHIKFIYFPYIPIPGLLLDYLQQQSDLKILHVYSDLDDYPDKDREKLQELIKRHKNLEVVSVRSITSDFIPILSELMYRPNIQQLSTKKSFISSFKCVHSLLSAFFLSPYPVTLCFEIGHVEIDDLTCILVPLVVNSEQQSKSLDVCLSLNKNDSSPIPEYNFLPQHIVLKSLRIESEALNLFSNVKSIKIDEITIFALNTAKNRSSLNSLLSIVSANDSFLFLSHLALQSIFTYWIFAIIPVSGKQLTDRLTASTGSTELINVLQSAIDNSLNGQENFIEEINNFLTKYNYLTM